MMFNKYYVSMVDTFMSGWGKAKGKKNVLIFECENLDEAKIVAENAENRSDQKDIVIHESYPHFLPASCFYVQHKNKSVYHSWYIKDYFKNKCSV